MRRFLYRWMFIVAFIKMCSCDDKCDEYTYFHEVRMWYKFNSVAKSFGDAYSICKDENASIAVPKNDDEMNRLIEIFQMYPDSVIKGSEQPRFLFLGIHDKFNPNEYNSLKGVGMQYIYNKWGISEPNYPEEHCVMSTRNGILGDFYCGNKQPFICEKPGIYSNEIVRSSKTYSYSQKLRKSYKIHTDIRTWGFARTICDAEDAHLAIITSKAEEVFLVTLLKENLVTNILTDYFAFIGFHDLYKEGLFITVKDDKLYDIPYINWTSDQPRANISENCGGINKLGSIGLHNCTLLRPFICEKSG